MRAPLVRLRLRLGSSRPLETATTGPEALEKRLGLADMLDRLRISGQAGDAYSVHVAHAHGDAAEGLNRYNDVLPFDHSIPSGAHFGTLAGCSAGSPPTTPLPYINASRIPAFVLPADKNSLPAPAPTSIPQAFVATQAPLPHTFPRFFDHLTSDCVVLLINLTRCEENGVAKADRYWPEQIGGTAAAGDWRVTLLACEDLPCGQLEVTRRRLLLSQPGTATSHELTQLHITSWPDFGSTEPERYDQLLSLIQNENQALNTLHTTKQPMASVPPPIWCHCSAGIGRTGTVIAGLMALEYLAHRPALPRTMSNEDREHNAEELALALISHMRAHRPGMVQGTAQATMIVRLIKFRSGKMEAHAGTRAVSNVPPSAPSRKAAAAGSNLQSYPPSSRQSSARARSPSDSSSRRPSLMGRSPGSRRASLTGPSPSPRRLSNPTSEGEGSHTLVGLARSLSRSLSSRRRNAQKAD